MEKFSVKKPFTILVAVIIIIVFGFVSVTGMPMEMLPEMDIPYLMVITTYPGASPERVESEVSQPMEKSLGTVAHVKNVNSISAENFSMVQLEFESGTNMDSAMVKVSTAIDQVKARIPESCGTPNIMEISMDMLATMYIGVEHKGDDIYELSDYITNEFLPRLEREEGVASVTDIGLVEKTIQVELNAGKINGVNDRILAMTSRELDKSLGQLNSAKAQLANAQNMLNTQEKSFGSTLSNGIFKGIGGGVTELAKSIQGKLGPLIDALKQLENSLNASGGSGGSDSAGGDTEEGEDGGEEQGSGEAIDPIQQDFISRLNQLIAELSKANGALGNVGSYTDLMKQFSNISSLLNQLQALGEQMSKADLGSGSLIRSMSTQIQNLYATLDQAPKLLDSLETTFGTLTQAQLDAALGFARAADQLSDSQAQLDSALSQYESAREKALKSANLNALVTAPTLSQLIYAQNFSMPAGYIDDQNDNSWLLKIGDEFDDADDLSSSLLCRIDGVGTILLADVADVTVIDNSLDTYAKVNGEDSVVLSIYKGSSVGTNEMSSNVKKAIEEMQEEDENLEVLILMDQGEYINMIVSDVVKSMILGAILAIIVLALFLKSVRPTLVVAISIPLSVLFALTLMYFTDLSLNIMTLSGLSLGIGMLVDNSIVVLENIFRLRSRGLTAAHAAVQGTRQVSGAIVASTLTTVCVFVPMVFTEGTVRQLLLPMALGVAYCLAASLIVAMTVVPAASSTLMRTMTPKTNSTFEKIQNKYAATLRWCLSRKALALGAAILLLVISSIRLFTMGIVILPDMEGEEVNVSITTPEGDDRLTSYAKADQVMDAILQIDGVEYVGGMSLASTSGMFTSVDTGRSDAYGTYTCYVQMEEDYSGSLKKLSEQILDVTSDIDAEVEASAGNGGGMGSMMSSGLSLNIYGKDLEQLTKIGNDICGIVESVEGFTNVSDGSEKADRTLHLVINKDKAMSMGITVAQVYAKVAERMNTSVTSTTITTDGVQYDVIIEDGTNKLTRENILDIEFESSSAGAGASGGAAAGGGMAAMMGGSGGASMGGGAAASGGDGEVHKLGEFATLEESSAMGSIRHENLTRYLTITAETEEGYNTTLLSRDLKDKLEDYEMPSGYSYELGGETDQVNDMVRQMIKLMLLALLLIYLIMVAQFQSLLSPFIIMFTIPLAFTGGMLGLIVTFQQLSMLSMMGFLILVGTVVNNGIVFVDYTNRLRKGGMSRHDALVATGQTRMRPIVMTAMTTILAMTKLIIGNDMGSQMGRGMAIVICGGLLYATIMTLYIVPIMYDILFKRQPLDIDVGDDLDDTPDDAEEFLRQLALENQGAGGSGEAAMAYAGADDFGEGADYGEDADADPSGKPSISERISKRAQAARDWIRDSFK